MIHVDTHADNIYILVSVSMSEIGAHTTYRLVFVFLTQTGFIWEEGTLIARCHYGICGAFPWLMIDMGVRHPWAGGPGLYKKQVGQAMESQASKQHCAMASAPVPARGLLPLLPTVIETRKPNKPFPPQAALGHGLYPTSRKQAKAHGPLLCHQLDPTSGICCTPGLRARSHISSISWKNVAYVIFLV